MSGWDVSSTPKWGPQDGPEETQGFNGQGDGSRDFPQDFGVQDFGRGGPSSPPEGFPEVGGGYPGEGQAGGPPPEFFGQEYGQDQEPGSGGFPRRTPGRSFQDLPRRETRGGYSGDGYGQENGYGAENGYGHDNGYGQYAAFGQDNGYGHDAAFGQDNGYGQEAAFGQDAAFGREAGFAQDSAYGQNWGGGGAEQPDPWAAANGQDNDGGWGRAAGRSAAPWEERPQQDAYPGQEGQEFGQQGFGQQEFGQQEFGGQDYTRQAQRPSFATQDYDGQEFPGQQGRGSLDAPGFERGDRDMAARMDPALQDFFAPQRGGGTSGYPSQAPGRSGEPRDRFRPSDDGWEDPVRPQLPRPGTGPRPMPRGSRRDDPEPRSGVGVRGLVAIGVVAAVVVGGAVVLLTHKSGGGSPAATSTPSGGTVSSAAAKPSTGGKAAGTTGTGAAAGGAGAAAGAYTLSTPATAGGYPIGQDPSFLTTATATAGQVSTAVTAGGGGTASGNPVSAAYQLPDSQVITFVGYKGTFTPAKVETILASLGSDPNTYPAGANGGILGCANTKTTPSGAVCVWATSSTLGITEFFTATGPETLNAAQNKGADDTVKLRADVEKKA